MKSAVSPASPFGAAVMKSALSLLEPPRRVFQASIKSAASTASRTPKKTLKIENVLTRVYPFIKLNDIDTNGIIELIHNDKKNEAGKIYTVLLQGIGSSRYHNEVTEKELGEALLHISMLSDIYN